MAPGDGGGADTMLACTLNLAKVIAGAGMMSLPWLFVQTGFLAGSLALAAVAACTYATLVVLVDAAGECGASSYFQLTERLLGRAARRVLQVAVVLFCFGFVVVYVVVIADVLAGPPPPAPCGGLLCELFGGGGGGDGFRPSRGEVVVGFALLVAPLLLLRSQDRLAPLNALGVAAVVLLSASAGALGATAAVRGTSVHTPDLPPLPPPPPPSSSAPEAGAAGGRWRPLLEAVPVMLASMIAHQSVLPLRAYLRPYSDRRMRRVCGGALCIVLAAYLALALGAATAFGERADPDVLANFSAAGLAATGLLRPAAAALLSYAVRVSYCLSLCVGVLLYVHPLRAGLAVSLWPDDEEGGGAAAEGAGGGGGGGAEENDAEAPLLAGDGGSSDGGGDDDNGAAAFAAASSSSAQDGGGGGGAAAAEGAAASPPPPSLQPPRWQVMEQTHYYVITFGLLAAVTACACWTDNVFVALSAIGDLASTVQGFMVPGAIAVCVALRGGSSSSSSSSRKDAAAAAAGAAAAGGAASTTAERRRRRRWRVVRRTLRGGAGAVVLAVGVLLFVNGCLQRVR